MNDMRGWGARAPKYHTLTLGLYTMLLLVLGYQLTVKAQNPLKEPQSQQGTSPEVQHSLWTLKLAQGLASARAEQMLTSLRRQGLDVYSLASDDGYNVYLGCFDTEASAEHFLGVLEPLANPTEPPQLTQSLKIPPSGLCLNQEIAFKLPEVWTLESYHQWLAFHIELDGHTRYMLFDGVSWYIAQSHDDYLQAIATIEANLPTTDDTPQVEVSWLEMNGLIIAHTPSHNIIMASAKLLWQKGKIALVDEGDGNLNVLRLSLLP